MDKNKLLLYSIIKQEIENLNLDQEYYEKLIRIIANIIKF